MKHLLLIESIILFGMQPSCIFRDNNGIYGEAVSRFLLGTGIEEVKTATAVLSLSLAKSIYPEARQ